MKNLIKLILIISIFSLFGCSQKKESNIVGILNDQQSKISDLQETIKRLEVEILFRKLDCISIKQELKGFKQILTSELISNKLVLRYSKKNTLSKELYYKLNRSIDPNYYLTRLIQYGIDCKILTTKTEYKSDHLIVTIIRNK